jgi:hypothetical protein
MSLYENLLYDGEKQEELQKEIKNLDSNQAVAQEPIIGFLKSKVLLDSIILRSAISKFGIDNLPFLLRDDLIPQGERHSYFSIPRNLEYTDRRFVEIKNAKDITEPDFESMVTIMKLAERIDAKENLLLHHRQ